jgi:hypothetical protein
MPRYRWFFSLLLLLLAWSPVAEAQWRPRPGPPPGRFRRGPPPGAPAYPRPCVGPGGSCGLVDDLRAVGETETTDAGDAVITTPSEPTTSSGSSGAGGTQLPAQTPASVPYFYQYANLLHKGSSCQNTSLAMLLGYYGVKVTPDQITSRFGKDKAQSPEGLAQVFNTLAAEAGIPQRLRAHRDGSMGDLNRQLQAGTPTIVHGYFTGYGHVVLATGYDGSSYTVNDPAGRWSGVFKGGYGGAQSPTAGRGVQYSKSSFTSAVGTSDGSSTLPVWWHEVTTTR